MHIFFSQVEYEAFRNLLLYLNSGLALYLPSSGNTIRNWIIEDFKQRQDRIKKELHLSRSLVYFSFDMWTSPNSMAIISVPNSAPDGLTKDGLVWTGRTVWTV